MLKTGNCCWLVFSIFLACVQTKFWQKVVRLRCRKAFNFLIFPTNSFHVAENSVHISSRLLVCVCTFLLVDKIVYGLSAFGDACFSFCIKSFPIFRIINSLGECSSSSSIFEILVKFQSFLLWRMTIFTFFFSLFWLQSLNLPALLQNRNTWLRLFPWQWSVLQNPDGERTNQSARICPRLALPYNNSYCYYRCVIVYTCLWLVLWKEQPAKNSDHDCI